MENENLQSKSKTEEKFRYVDGRKKSFVGFIVHKYLLW